MAEKDSSLHEDWQDRTRLLLGHDAVDRMQRARVLVVGLGGVGAYAAEMICRAGVGHMTIVDGDVVDLTNLNRQLPALHSTLGKPKAEVMAARLRDINPELDLDARQLFIHDEITARLLDSHPFDYVVDAIDSLSPKVHLVLKCRERQLPLISSMGSGRKTDPSQIRIADISETSHCRLARAMRKMLRRHGVEKGVRVVYSLEESDPDAVIGYIEEETGLTKSRGGTISYLPAIFGCWCASEVISRLTDEIS
ncbi:MAG: tRNA threonylcarbamoyladenosine dehydratase [Victivallales bacterium]|nr:tRNA threonylcarbamoyladenosine dehydratase [Victivallales bacterium]